MYRSREVRARWAPYTNFDASHRLEVSRFAKIVGDGSITTAAEEGSHFVH